MQMAGYVRRDVEIPGPFQVHPPSWHLYVFINLETL